ncbi:sulfotransferase family cytosolic 1B member 1-like [Protopterus annectens]|uniref:sulfotransferase family cytosolic 1B member 1-like n=1 Tax=Protopterus annectens TaxID=7888 RepID=UPI001CF97699|nr:sulfotransferase family cytosolic 1B member 1-like [Protopterus annectens]
MVSLDIDFDIECCELINMFKKRGYPGHILYELYEEVKDLRGSVVKICQFLEKNLDDDAVDAVVRNASFSCMKDNKMANFTLVPETMMDHKRSPFMRKGICGDWKNHFTIAQSKYFNKVYQERMKDAEIKFVLD